MSELRDRLERLASRGTRRGADDVLRAAQGAGSPEIGVVAADRDDRDLEILDDIPLVSAEPARRRGRFSTLIAATGVAALVGIGMLAVTAMFGSGGADSPEAAVRQLADAVSHRDPLAAVDVLAPSEVRSMHESVQHISTRAADLKVVDNASQPLAGVDLSVDHLQLSSTDLADGYAKVTITSGTLSAGAHRAALSKLLQEAMRNSDTPDPEGKVDLTRLAAASDLPTFVMTVRHDGRWYVSPAYTALEYAREANHGPAADFGSADASKLGADTPGHAVEDALRAWQASDWNRLLELAPPDELPVYDYRAWITQEAADTHSDFTIDSLTTTDEVSGDRGVVKLEASGTMGSGNDRGRWQVGGSCPYAGDWLGYSSSDSFSGSEGWQGSAPPTTRLCLAGDLGQAVPLGLFAMDPSPAPSASGPISIEVVREGGRWFVSPVGTALDVIDNFVQRFDERSLYPLIGLGYLLPPEQTLTLNQPAPLADSTRYARVLAFDGTAGQKVVGEVENSSLGGYFYSSAEVYTADGRDVGYVDLQQNRKDSCCASPVTLPATGSYRLVMFEQLPSDTTITVWDTDHAPKSLLNDGPSGQYSDGIEQCVRTLNAETCSSSAYPVPSQVGKDGPSGVTATTSP